HPTKRPLPGLRFESLDQAQAYLDRWEAHWADTRIHGTTKRQVAAMFAEEQPALGPLPLEPFRYYRFGVRTVHLDGCVEVDAAYYGAPPGWIGRRVDVQWNDLFVRVLALAKKHGPAVVEDAAKAALDLGVPTYRFLRRYLDRRPPVPLTLRQVDPLIRQLTLYRDLIDRTTGDPS